MTSVETNVNAPLDVKTCGDILVSDAKKMIELKYPKLHGRFNHAFNGLPDDMLLRDAIDAISSDVSGWLGGMPENFKTSNHAISRPKFGLSYVLQLDEVRAALGGDYCDIKNTSIDRAFEALKKDFVIPSEKKESTNGAVAANKPDAAEVETDETDDDGKDESAMSMRMLVLKLEQENAFLKDSLVSIVNEQHGRTIGAVFNALLSYKFE